MANIHDEFHNKQNTITMNSDEIEKKYIKRLLSHNRCRNGRNDNNNKNKQRTQQLNKRWFPLELWRSLIELIVYERSLCGLLILFLCFVHLSPLHTYTHWRNHNNKMVWAPIVWKVPDSRIVRLIRAYTKIHGVMN